MFNITDFLMKTIKGMIGTYPDFQVREYAANWYAKGKLTEENLAELDALIESQYIEPPVVEETETEETEIIEDSTNEEMVEETTTEPTE